MQSTKTKSKIILSPALTSAVFIMLFYWNIAGVFAQDSDFAQAAKITLGNGNVSINRAGAYVLSGTLRNGQVFIEVGSKETVRIQLNGVFIENPNGAAIYMKKGAQLIINLAAGTENTLMDGKNYRFAPGEDEPKAALFVKNNLTIGGSGKLSITGNYRNGIHAKDMLTISGGTISVNAAEEAIQGSDGIVISGGEYKLQAGNDGIKSNNSGPGKGNVTINGGTFTIAAGRDAVQAANNLVINGGNFTVNTGGGAAVGAAMSGRNSFGNGDWGRRGWNRQNPTPSVSENNDSFKAFKAGKELVINAGTFTIDAQDDAFHSNGNLTVKRGTFTINTGDDAFHADNALRVEGGTINILSCYEGLEGKAVDISGGNITVVSADDAINAADGNTAPAGRGGRAVNNGVYIRISGGTLRILAGGDGIDANGNLFLEGGEIYISGPSMGMEGAIDFDNNFVVTGGKLITAGSSLSPSSQSSQPVILLSYTAVQNSGSNITLKDRSGRTVLEYTAQIQFSASAFSSPDLKIGEVYSLFINGKKLTDITLRGTVTALADNGGAYSVGRGGRRF